MEEEEEEMMIYILTSNSGEAACILTQTPLDMNIIL